MDKVLILFHKGCTDGFASAVVSFYNFLSSRSRDYSFQNSFQHHVQLVYKGIDPGSMSAFSKELITKYTSDWKVVTLDLAYTKESFLTLYNHFKDFHAIDHHITTKEQCIDRLELLEQKKSITFDNDHCGAVLTFKHYFPFRNIPLVLKYIEDRDLWKFENPFSKEITTGLYEAMEINYVEPKILAEFITETCITDGKLTVVPFIDEEKVPNLSAWIEYLLTDDWVESVKNIGTSILKLQNRTVKGLSHTADLKEIDGKKVFVVQSNSHISDLGAYLNGFKNEQGEYICDYVLIWRYDHKEKKCFVSLRSRKENKNINVSTVALTHGGGGHTSASGFECTMSQLISLLGI